MVNRYYVCDACDYAFVVQQELHDETRLKKCPSCGKHKLYQDLTGQHTFVYGEPKTLHHQAARNTERAGRYQLESEQQKIKRANQAAALSKAKKAGLVPETAEELPPVKNPWYNPEGKDLTKELKGVLTSKEKMKKYILDGEK